MKRIILALGLAVTFLSPVGLAQTSPPKPGPEHHKVRVFVGHWTYEGEYKPGPLGPGGKAAGEYTVQPILGGFFVQGHWTEKGPWGETKGFETFGYNPATNNYLQSQYASDGTIAGGSLTVNGNAWDYTGMIFLAGKRYGFKATMTFTADLMGLEMKTALSADGNTWAPFGEFIFTKVTAPPKK